MEFQKRTGEIAFTSEGPIPEKRFVEVNDIVTLKTNDETIKVKISKISEFGCAGGIIGSGAKPDTQTDDSVCFFYDDIYACHKS